MPTPYQNTIGERNKSHIVCGFCGPFTKGKGPRVFGPNKEPCDALVDHDSHIQGEEPGRSSTMMSPAEVSNGESSSAANMSFENIDGCLVKGPSRLIMSFENVSPASETICAHQLSDAHPNARETSAEAAAAAAASGTGDRSTSARTRSRSLAVVALRCRP